MPDQEHLFTGKAGQMAVMAEFLLRGYNVAVPEVDVGDDILVVRSGNTEYSRVQVKTTTLKQTRNGYSGRYVLKLSQLVTISAPEIWYVFANRFEDKWQSFMIVPRPALHSLYEQHNLGSLNQNGLLSLYITYSANKATCSGQDLSRFLNNWSDWPPV